MEHRHLSFLRQSSIYISEKKNKVWCVQIPQQSFLKIFQNVIFIVFCTRIYMVMNNLRVGDRVIALVVKVLHFESERSRFKPY